MLSHQASRKMDAQGRPDVCPDALLSLVNIFTCALGRVEQHDTEKQIFEIQ